MASFDLRFSIECVDNASGSGRVIVFEDKTVPFSSQQDARERTASNYSSVQPFQSDYDQNEGTAMDWEPAETDSNSLASSVQPFQSDYDQNEDTAMDCEPAETDSNSLASLQEEEKDGGRMTVNYSFQQTR